MDAGTAYVIAYCIQIPLAIYAAFFIPMRGELSAGWDNGRKAIIWFGILPCAFLSVLYQVCFLAVYLLKVKSVEASARKAQAKLSAGSARPSTGGNPFGSSSGSPSPAPKISGGNPFGGASSGNAATPGDNPFA